MKITFRKMSEHNWCLTDGEFNYYYAAYRSDITVIIPEELHRLVWHAAYSDGEEAYALLMAAKIRGEW
jgi:hypothetical protein